MAARGKLRVLLGAAPGVGKTFAMLEEAHRLLQEGRDVCIGIVESHDRAATAAMASGIPVVPPLRISHRGMDLHELDLPGLLQRHPDVVLVDELAHSNAPGTAHEKRWQDIEELLAAGIDVISTVNVQHIESLNDVAEQITGVRQHEQVPDRFLRSATQVEVVDLAPQALRDRLTGGLVYPAERIDAAMSNYFRLGNLTALRELALIWLADEVDQALTGYRKDHGIENTWEARERVVVALTGGPEGETLLRRGSRIATRSAGGDLIAVHITGQDGLRSEHPAALAHQRALVERLNGTYHQVIGEDIATALVDFARSVNATQLVLGTSRRGRLSAALTGAGIGTTVIRKSGDIDVHMVNHAAAGCRFALPPLTGALTLRRRLFGAGVALVGGPALTAGLLPLHNQDSITTEVLGYQLLVVIVSLIGGIWPAVFAAMLSGITLDYFFVEPRFTMDIQQPHNLVSLALYMVIAGLVSFIVDRAARRTRAARRSAAESELIQTIAGSVIRGDNALHALVVRTREAFRLHGVRVLRGDEVLAQAGGRAVAKDPSPTVVPLTADTRLELNGPEPAAAEQRLLAVVVAQLTAALEHQALARTAERIQPIEASDRVRGALLSALSHDLRRPLAAATTAVGGLRSAGTDLSAEDRGELLDTAHQSLSALATLVTDLLDVSRLQAEALTIAAVPTDPAEVIAPALDELQLGPTDVTLALHHDITPALADPVLLQRVLVNLLTNALRHSPEGTPVHLSTSTFEDRVEIRVVDRGPGIPTEEQDQVFLPFQRLGDTDNTTGLGLGLALSRGFVEAMHGTLSAEDTPGGGLTMVIALPAVRPQPTHLEQQ